MYNVYCIEYIANKHSIAFKMQYCVSGNYRIAAIAKQSLLEEKKVLIISVLFANDNEIFRALLPCNTSNSKNIVKLYLFLRQVLLILHNLQLLHSNQGNHLYAHHHVCQ